MLVTELYQSNRRTYHRIECSLNWVAENFHRQPSLMEIARRAHMSEYHFQRLFTRWAGITPKKYLQYVTLQYIKSVIADSESNLDAALGAGLSGTGRLHDLFVNVHAVTPGEYRSRCDGVSITYGFHDTPLGECAITTTERGICGLAFRAERSREHTLNDLKRGFENARFERSDADSKAVVDSIFAPLYGDTVAEPRSLSVLLRGTSFQMKVWEALLVIPFGHVVSYQFLAKQIGRPKAVRAVAGANTRNLIAYLIPCHRVIRGSGVLGGYRWGMGRKLALIGLEAVHRQQPTSSAANTHALVQ